MCGFTNPDQDYAANSGGLVLAKPKAVRKPAKRKAVVKKKPTAKKKSR
jgi:hypothetical protein